MKQSNSEKTHSTMDIVKLVLDLNDEYWKSRYNNHYMNSLGHYENEIYGNIHWCFVILSPKECIEAFDVFKQNHVDFDAQSLNGNTLLFTYAICQLSNKEVNNKYYDRMQLLLDYGANPDFYTNLLKNQNNSTCLMQSVQDRHRFQLLLQYGADPFFIPDKRWNTIFDYIEDIIDHFENNHSNFKCFNILDNSIQDNMEDIKINRDLAQSIVQKQQISDWFQSKSDKTNNQALPKQHKQPNSFQLVQSRETRQESGHGQKLNNTKKQKSVL